MNKIQRPVIALSIAISALVVGLWPMAAMAATQPRLLTATPFAVLANSTITNTGPTVIHGAIGLSPGSAVTGFPPGAATSQHKADAVARKAQTSLVTTYTDLASWGPTRTLTGKDLGTVGPLTPGVYTFSSSAQLTGTLTLIGNGIFIFQIGSTLTTATNSKVVTKGGNGCGVYWKVGSSATLGVGTQFKGTIVALASITMNTGATILPGRALARTGAVTLDSNLINLPTGPCSATGTTSTTTTSTTATLAQTGGGPSEGGFPWVLLLIAGIAGSFGVLRFSLSNGRP